MPVIERHFLVIALFLSACALIYPPAFIWAKSSIPYLLGVIMFGMGLTLEMSDFALVLKRWKIVLLGIAAQYSIMPLLSLALSYLFNLSYDIFIGMVILGACPGGTASNVITYLSRGNVALSVTMTFLSTLIAPVVTPGIIYLFVGTMVEIEFWSMVKSVFWIVVFPLVDGLILRRFLREHIKPLLSIFPSISIMAISFVIAIIMGLNKELDFGQNINYLVLLFFYNLLI